MKAGYNWELGPFEMFDAAGVRATTEKMRAAGAPVSTNVEKLLAVGEHLVQGRCLGLRAGGCTSIPLRAATSRSLLPEGVSSIAVIKKARGVVKKNAGASVIDLGDGVAAIELHSKMNALGDDIVSLITQTLQARERAGGQLRGVRDYRRLGELFGRRQPDATAPDDSGRGVGRG